MREGAIDVILKAMRGHVGDIRVQRAACRALAQIVHTLAELATQAIDMCECIYNLKFNCEPTFHN